MVTKFLGHMIRVSRKKSSSNIFAIAVAVIVLPNPSNIFAIAVAVIVLPNPTTSPIITPPRL